MEKKYVLMFLLFIVFFISPVINNAQDVKPNNTTINYSATIKVGIEFKYQFDFKLPATVINPVYKLLRFPDGMMIDEKTGLITWTPKATGEFSAEVTVNSNSVKIGSAILKLRVVEFLGSISGLVLSDDGNVLANVIVTAYKKVVVTGKLDSYAAFFSTPSDASGAYKINGLDSGTYFLFAQTKPMSSDLKGQYNPAYYEDSQTIDKATPINIKDETPFTANFKLHKRIIILTNTYSATLNVNQEFKYQIDTKLSAGLPNVSYKLNNGPAGMTVDPQKGLVTWTPTTKGEYSAEISVLTNNDKAAVVVLKLKVVNFYGTIAGTVKSDDAVPVPLQNVQITLFKKIAVTAKPDYYQATYSVFTDASGSYRITNIDSSAYYVYAKPSYEKIITANASSVMYLPAYYKDSQTIDKADLVPVINSNTVEVNFILHKYIKPEPVKATITGIVTDASNKPIAGARITLTATQKAITNGMPSTMDPANMLISQDASLGCFADILSDTRTDANGKYSITLVAGGSYIASANAEGYSVQYYNGKSNILDADKIVLSKDISGIDFKLTALPVAKAVISGKVTDADKNGVVSKIILYPAIPVMSMSAFNKIIRSAATNDKGEFTFEKVPNGKYFLQAVPAKNYMPGYYKANDCGVNEFKNADTINVKNDVSVSGLTICVKKIVTHGSAVISGIVRMQNGTGLGGVIVTAESESDCSFAITESNGAYEIENLGTGEYTINSDKIGYTSSASATSSINYDKNIFASSVNITMNNNFVTDVKQTDEIPNNFSLEQNYPNPFNPSTIIKYQLSEASYVTLKVYDILGKEVASLVDEYISAGTFLVKFDGSKLSSGIYFYKLQANNFVEAKKMMLMK